MNLECRKVQALMSLYIDDALSEKLKNFVQEHLEKCKICMQKYMELKKTMKYLKEHLFSFASKMPQKAIFNVFEEEKFKISTSAYLDNELTGNEALKFKQYLEKNPHAKKFLQNFKTTDKYLKHYFKVNSPELKKDLSQKVINEIKQRTFLSTLSIRDTIITLILAIFTIITFFSIEKIIFPTHNLTKNEKISFSKIFDDIKKASNKNFFY